MLLKDQALRPAILSGLVVAFSSFGDAFLYASLPANALQLHVPIAWVGLLLSINRFVRLFANQFFAYCFHRFGFRSITIAAAVLSMLSTLAYGISSSILLWVVARIVWGCCYAALRISAISYSLQQGNQSLPLGINKGLQEAGPILALLVGPWLLEWVEPATAFYIFAAASFPAIVLSLYLPAFHHSPLRYKFSLGFVPSTLNLITFLTSFFVQGVLIVGMSGLLIAQGFPVAGVTALVAGFLAYRRACAIVVSPVAGWLAQRFGMGQVYLMALVGTIFGLLLVALGATSTGIVVTFTFGTVIVALSPGNAACGSADKLKAVAANNTWSDVGAAAGALIAGTFLETDFLIPVFFLATFVLSAAGILYIKTTNFSTNQLPKWR